jgi:hypothetical protein
MFREWNPRTRARYKTAMTLLGQEDQKEVIQLVTRPNGSVNVSRMLEMAIVRYVARLETR